KIHPSAAPGSSGRRSKFMTGSLKLLSGFIEEFGRERATPYPGAIGLGDSDHFADSGGCDAQSAAYSTAGGVGRSDVGVGAVFDVEHGALSAFCQNGLIVRQ